ncbi:ABC transporter substrate-binding protein [Streptomyces sp. N35]|uniref:ABC transporter substrate-binding protein n=1 Tax=Streptomyces sp. N35 TaxID=2795730 RepID=UPI0018F6BF22|nr:ABC transporter substrate-binding protein [Streptomyces sp. N35]
MGSSLSRRRVLAVTAAGTLTPVLAGCGALAAADSDADTLVIHNQMGGTAIGAPTFHAAVADFRRENPGVDVKLLVNGDDLAPVYETSRLARKEADIVIVNLYDKTLEWTAVDATVPVGDYLDRWGLRERVVPQALQQWTDADGRLRAFPYFASNWPVAYNMDLLRDVGLTEPPTSTDQLVDAARLLRAKRRAPVAVGGNDWTGQKLLFQIIQTHLTAEQAQHVFATGDFSAVPGAGEGIEHFTDLRDAGVFADNAQGLTSDSMTTQYNTGQAAVMSALSSALARVPAATAAQTVVGGWPVPAGSAHSHPTVMRSYSLAGLWISPNGTQKPELIEKFVRFMYRPHTVSRFVTEAGRDMAVRTDTTSPDFPLVTAAKELTDNVVSQVLLPDLLIPARANQALIQATSTAFTPGTNANAIRGALESAYRRV